MKIYVKVIYDKNKIFEGIAELTQSKKSTKNQKLPTKTTESKGATLINQFYLENYFEKSRTLNDVENKIKSLKYNLAITSISNSLQRSKYLKRQGTIGKYSFIQKATPN